MEKTQSLSDKPWITAYEVSDRPPPLQKGSVDRDWMSLAQDRFPYRCLPLSMANQLGWDVINPDTFTVTWNGGPKPSDVQIEWPNPSVKNTYVSNHFGCATFTITLGHLFQTSPGVGLLVMGCPNQPIDGLVPLMGYVETDWLPATFTMNFLITRPNFRIVFDSGVPYCRVIPYPRGWIEQFTPTVQDLKSNPTFQSQYKTWTAHRDKFNKDLKIPGSAAVKQGWQKDYFLGGGNLTKTGSWKGAEDHQTHFQHKEFVDQRERPINREIDPTVQVKCVRVGKPTDNTWVWVKQSLLKKEKKDGSK